MINLKKLILISFALTLILSLCACTGSENNNDNATTAGITSVVPESSTEATTQPHGVELTLKNVEQYLSFEVSMEYSDVNPNGADHILKIAPLIEGDYSGVHVVVEVPLYDHWYNSYTTEIDLTADITLTKVGKATSKHPVFCDVTDLYETRGLQTIDDPTYIIKSVSGTVK